MTKVYDFDVTVTTRHEDCNEQFKENAIEEVLKLSKYHSHIIDGDITIDKQNSSYRVEISLHIPGHTFIATNQDYNLTKALDATINKTKIQLKKLKSKIIDHRIAPQAPETERVEAEEALDLEQ